MTNSSLGRRRWMSKFVTNNCAVGITMVQRKQRTSDECPRCAQLGEDNFHVLKCQSEEATDTWTQCMIDLIRYMRKLKTNEKVIEAITTNLYSWRNDLEYPSSIDYDIYLQQAIIEQNRIGWNNFALGRLSKKWRKVFLRMYPNHRCKQLTPKLLIQRLMDITFQMWDNRNKILHDKTNIHKLHGEKEIDFKIKYQLALGTDNLLPNDEHLVDVDAETTLNKTLFHKKEWLSSVESARTCQMPDRMKDFNYSRNVLSKWLGTKSYRRRKPRRRSQRRKRKPR